MGNLEFGIWDLVPIVIGMGFGADSYWGFGFKSVISMSDCFFY
jgi:hypothetical protein